MRPNHPSLQERHHPAMTSSLESFFAQRGDTDTDNTAQATNNIPSYASLPPDILSRFATRVPVEASFLFSKARRLEIALTNGRLNFAAGARDDLKMLVRMENPPENVIETLCQAAIQLDAPFHLSQRCELLDKLGDMLDGMDEGYAGPDKHFRISGILEKLISAAASASDSTSGSSLPNDPGRTFSLLDSDNPKPIVADDVAHLPFALKVGQMVKRHLPSLSPDEHGRANDFLKGLEVYTRLVPAAADKLLFPQVSRDPPARHVSQWTGRGPKEWHSLETRFLRPLTLAMQQANFPVVELFASHPFSSRNLMRRDTERVIDLSIKLNVALKKAAFAHLPTFPTDFSHDIWNRVIGNDAVGDCVVNEELWDVVAPHLDLLVAASEHDLPRQDQLIQAFQLGGRENNVDIAYAYSEKELQALNARSDLLREAMIKGGLGTLAESAGYEHDELRLDRLLGHLQQKLKDPTSETLKQLGATMPRALTLLRGWPRHCTSYCGMLRTVMRSPRCSTEVLGEFLKNAWAGYITLKQPELHFDATKDLRAKVWGPLVRDTILLWKQNGGKSFCQDLKLDRGSNAYHYLSREMKTIVARHQHQQEQARG